MASSRSALKPRLVRAVLPTATLSRSGAPRERVQCNLMGYTLAGPALARRCSLDLSLE